MIELTGKPVGTFSRGMARIAGFTALSGSNEIILTPASHQAKHLGAIVGWGAKPNTDIARRYAARHHIPFVAVEDGFLRSVDLGVNGAAPLSIILDSTGVYYDASRPSDLENLLNCDGPDDPLNQPELTTRAAACIQRIVDGGLSKYNNSPTTPLPELPGTKRILVVDQTFGDMSILRGLVPEDGFNAMLDAAITEHPDAEIFVKTHPDVLTGKKRGNLTRIPRGPRLHLLTESVNPISLLRQMHHVYVATSQLGFEALMAGVPTTCFGAPFYAGWGLTDDRVAIPRRTARRSLEGVFAAAYILYPRYIHPDKGIRGTIEDVIDHLLLQRDTFARNEGVFFCRGVSIWKHGTVRAYLRCPGNRVHFSNKKLKLPPDASRHSSVLVWGRSHANDTFEEEIRHREIPFYHMEDGFLRSVGLGSDLTLPASLVVDSRGIYFDPGAPSDLEHILQHAEFTNEEIKRAAALRESIVALKVSKYNVDGGDRLDPPPKPGARIILVPGQVEDDASIQRGTVDIRTNLALLETARKNHPDAFILFKPHPDVVSSNRRGHIPDTTARMLADAVLYDSSIAYCLDLAHEVHTMTSLVGFEALLRGLNVHAYGRPFYSGWGLTTDRHRVDRRTRTLSLDELVAGTLIRYPRYLNPGTMAFTTPEFIVLKLREAADGTRNLATRSFRPFRQLRRLINLVQGMIHARKL